MKLKIVDASVAIKWFVLEENAKEEADAVLTAIEADPTYFGVPELFFNEMLAVFCRLKLSELEIQNHMKCLQNLGFRRIENGSELIAEAIRIAVTMGITGYDAIYAASAKLTNGVWVTADKVAHTKLKGLAISDCI